MSEDDRKARYEAKGERPRVSISARIKPETMAAIDRQRGKVSRSLWLRRLIARAIPQERDPK